LEKIFDTNCTYYQQEVFNALKTYIDEKFKILEEEIKKEREGTDGVGFCATCGHDVVDWEQDHDQPPDTLLVCAKCRNQWRAKE
jgi:hypothetical protein